jgi:hypothetical protein
MMSGESYVRKIQLFRIALVFLSGGRNNDGRNDVVI